MFKKPIEIIFLSFLTLVVVGSVILLGAARWSPLAMTGGSLVACGLLALLFVISRVAGFRGSLIRLIRQLLAGKYESGVPDADGKRDELTEIEKMLNKLAERLRTYDALRAERVRLSRLTLDMLAQSVAAPVMLFDAERETFECNPAMRTLLGVASGSLSRNAVQNIETNHAFMELLKKAIKEEKSPQSGQVELQMPAQESARTISIRILPVKDREGVVKSAVILVDDTAGDVPVQDGAAGDA